MVFRFFLGFFLIGACVIIELLILDKLTPNYIIISYVLGKIPATIISIEGNIRSDGNCSTER